MKVKSLSRVRLFVTPWTAAYQAPPSMGVSRQEYWSGMLSPSLADAYTYTQSQYFSLVHFKYKENEDVDLPKDGFLKY